MSVGKDVIAEVEQIPVETVCCKNCGSCAKHTTRYYCRAWRQPISKPDSDFCSFFYVEEDQ